MTPEYQTYHGLGEKGATATPTGWEFTLKKCVKGKIKIIKKITELLSQSNRIPNLKGTVQQQVTWVESGTNW